MDAGDDLICNQTGPGTVNKLDQRGIARPIGSHCDIGATEGTGGKIVPVTGTTPQQATIGTAFAHALAAIVEDPNGTPLGIGISVTFTVVPVNSAGGSFPGSAATATVSTDVNGVATAPTFTANIVVGSYTVTANLTVGPLGTPATFALTNIGIITATTTTVMPATVPFAAAPQNVALSANVTSLSAVNEGTVAFTVRDLSAVIVGNTVTSLAVTNGMASVMYPLPAGTPVGSYTITAVYNPGPDFLPSTGSNSLMVTANAAATTTTVMPATAPFAAVAQNITLNATVMSSSPINEGTVTFTVRNASGTMITSGTSGTVAAGSTSAIVSLPANTPVGSYTITAAYNPGPDFLTSSGTNTLSVQPSQTVASVAVTANGGGAASVKVGQSAVFKALATFVDGRIVDVSDLATWSIQGAPGIAVVDQHGVATGESPSIGGPVTVTAVYGGKTGGALLTVAPPRPIVILP